MANATSITINDLVANGQLVAPTAQVLDTGTAAVVLETPDLAGAAGRCFLDVTNTAANGLVVSVGAGDNPPAFRAGVGAVTGPSQAQNVRALLGPFDAARLAEGGGKLKVTFTPASGTIAANFSFYRLPKYS